ncbi:MAG: hypothetical protein N3B17_07180 [Chlorobi bacterium]|nr:hypothetical protein [Chlorobiota bacterium]
MMRFRTTLGVALVFIGIGLLGYLCVALLPFEHPVRITVQALASAAIGIAGMLLWAAWRKMR